MVSLKRAAGQDRDERHTKTHPKGGGESAGKRLTAIAASAAAEPELLDTEETEDEGVLGASFCNVLARAATGLGHSAEPH